MITEAILLKMNHTPHISGCDVLGADGLKSQYVILRLQGIDMPKLRAALGSKGGLAAAGVGIANLIPKSVLDLAAPVAQRKLRDDYGVDVAITFADAPPPPRAKSEFVPGAVVGAGMIGFGWLATYIIGKIVSR